MHSSTVLLLLKNLSHLLQFGASIVQVSPGSDELLLGSGCNSLLHGLDHLRLVLEFLKTNQGLSLSVNSVELLGTRKLGIFDRPFLLALEDCVETDSLEVDYGRETDYFMDVSEFLS